MEIRQQVPKSKELNEWSEKETYLFFLRYEDDGYIYERVFDERYDDVTDNYTKLITTI